VNGQDQRVAGGSVAVRVAAGAISLLALVSLLRPVAAHPAGAEVTITPTVFVYLPYTSRSEVVTTPGPTPVPDVDLIIWDIFVAPQQPLAGEPFLVTVRVMNRGSDATTDSTAVSISVAGFEDSFSIQPLASQGIQSVSWGLNLSTADEYTVRAEVDPGDFILETNESNNSLSLEFTVVE
jgi:subtilase family serine protease